MPERPAVPLAVVAREWTRIGVTGFGGPPAHISLLRALVVDRMGWMDAAAFQDANAACGLLPGPASTQLSIYCAYRVAGPAGALVGGLGFILPAVVLIIALSLLFLAHQPPLWIRGAGAGAGSAVAAVAVQAARGLLGPSLARAGLGPSPAPEPGASPAPAPGPRPGLRHALRQGAERGADRARAARWLVWLLAGAVAAALLGPYLVLVLVGCGLIEYAAQRGSRSSTAASLLPLLPASITPGGVGALALTAFKVGALSFGGGFVIIPLMQGDAVHVDHWMTGAQFLNAVALGQVTPGPVVATVAAVGYAAHGVTGALLAAVIAFAPSFAFVLLGGRRFERLRRNAGARAFLDGAGPAAIGAILGAAILLAGELQQAWQAGLLAAALVALVLVRRGVVEVLVAAGVIGAVLALAGAPLPH